MGGVYMLIGKVDIGVATIKKGRIGIRARIGWPRTDPDQPIWNRFGSDLG